jgi:hypothetical protein
MTFMMTAVTIFVMFYCETLAETFWVNNTT